jgi:predicted MFS family arabinose efflux permease
MLEPFSTWGFVGIITQGYFSSKYGLKKTIGTILVLTAILMAIFKVFVGTDWIILSLVYWDLVFKEALLACTQFQHVYTQPNSELQALVGQLVLVD